jgi:dTDP-4-dehydrorhamnose reductase
MFQGVRILITGASGCLGRHLNRSDTLAEHERLTPSHAELDITNARAVDSYFERERPELVIHCAALIRTRGMNSSDERRAMSRTNVQGTGHVRKAVERLGARLVYVSTDFVFAGDKPGGRYREDDLPCPLGYYALTKYAGECLALKYDGALAVRLSFNEDWPYPKSFVDRFTSKLFVADAARELARCAVSDLTGVLHVAGPRQSYFEFAQSLGAQVEPLTLAELSSPDPLPVDTSLDDRRWREHCA